VRHYPDVMPDAPVSDARRLPHAGAPRRPHVLVRRPAPAPRHRFVDVCAAVAGIGFGAVGAAVLTTESRGSLAAPGGLLTAAGRLAGFTGTYLLLIMVVLVARLPWLERSAGQDQLIRWHRQVASWAISLICAHVVLITLGYARAARAHLPAEIWTLLRSYPDILAAAVGFGLLVLASVTSYRHLRRRLRYETWWVVHLYLYLALALAFAHQIVTGVVFIGHPLVRGLWIVVWAATAGLVLVFRVGQPIWRSLRHQLRVVEVRDEAPGVVSVICRGRKLDRLAVSGGQFFQWRFLTRELWWQAHPYSLSALPRPPYLRVTIKGLGDQSSAMAQLRPGTPVAIEGPYGAFTHHAQSSDGVVLIGAGVGVTPLRALLEDLPDQTDVVVLIRASTVDDLVHRAEVASLVAQRGGRLHEIVGPRHRARLDARALRHAVPDIALRDVYVCGPEGFSAEIVHAALRLGVAQEQIHTEAFGF
jgi:predicted ferric reductase